VKRLVGEFLKADRKDLLRLLDQREIALAVRWRDSFDLNERVLGGSAKVKVGSVG